MFGLQILDLRSYLIGIVFAILCFNLIRYMWNRRYLYYYSIKVDGPFNWPIIGYAWKFLGSSQVIFNVINQLCKTYKTPASMWIGPHLFFVITDPKHYEIILNKTLHKTDLLYSFLNEILGQGLVSAPVNIWKPHRKLIQPTFNQKILNSFVKIFSEQSQNFNKDLDEHVGKGCFDIFPMFSKLTMTTVLETQMGNVKLTKERISNIYKWINVGIEMVHLRTFKVWYHLNMVWNLSSYSKILQKNTISFNEITREIVIQKRKEYKLKLEQNKTEEYNNGESKNRWKGFLDYIVEISEESGQLTNDEIVAEYQLLLIAGTDTSAAAMSFSMLMLGLYQDIQCKVYDELYSIFGDSNRPVEVEDLNKLVYLERVIKETMRLFPQAPYIARKLVEDIQLESDIIPKGASCLIVLFQTHRDPKIWKDPLQFNPDRFLPEEVAKRHPYAFIPFSAGPRNCIGLKYAMMVMKTVLSTILRTFKVSTNYKKFSDIKITHTVLLRCVDGFNVGLEYRN